MRLLRESLFLVPAISVACYGSVGNLFRAIETIFFVILFEEDIDYMIGLAMKLARPTKPDPNLRASEVKGCLKGAPCLDRELFLLSMPCLSMPANPARLINCYW